MKNKRKLKNRKNRIHKPTFAYHVANTKDKATASLFTKAIRSNSIAKITKGHSRKIAYNDKNKSLNQLRRHDCVVEKVDRLRHPGLLTLQIDRHHRLHTHEYWLREAN